MKGYIVLVALFFAILCSAQDDDYPKKFSFGYNYGTSITESDFSKHDESKLPMSRITKQDTNKLNGYAQTGFHYDVYLTYEIKRFFSAMISVYGDQFNYDINSLNNQYDKFFPPNTVSVSTGDNYYIVQYLMGGYLNPRVAGNLHVELKILAGLTTANYPGISFIVSPAPKTADYTNYTFQKGNGFGYNVGGGINYGAVIGPIGLGAHLNIDYEGSSISYPRYNVTSYSNTYFTSSTYNIPKTMAINLIQVTLGLSVEI